MTWDPDLDRPVAGIDQAGNFIHLEDTNYYQPAERRTRMSEKLICADAEGCGATFLVTVVDSGRYKTLASAEEALLDCPVCPICGADAEEVEE